MPLKSNLYQGQIYAGETQLASTIAILQTAPMQLTVSAGSFTTTGDKRAGVPPQTFTLAADAVFDLTSDPVDAKAYQAELGVAAGVVDVLMRSRFAQDAYPNAPVGWQKVHDIIFEFIVPPGTVDLAGIDIVVLTILPGFPQGTDAEDWLSQSGSV